MESRRGAYGLEQSQCHSSLLKGQEGRTWETIHQSWKGDRALLSGGISKHVKGKKGLGSGPYGFTKGKSCLTNLVAFCDGMTGWVDEGRAVDAVYPDFSKAFDTDSFNILLGKLRRC